LSTRCRLRPHRTRFFTNLRLRSLLWNYNATLLRLGLWSLRRCDAFTTRLLLSWPDRTFSLRCTSRTLNARLLLALPLLDYARLSRLFDRAPLFDRSWLFRRSRLFRSFRSLCSLRWRRIASTLTLTLVSHLELLSLSALRRRIHTHFLRKIRTEPWCCQRCARNDRRVAQLACDSRRNVNLAATPR
jgi:hypothetical protein